MTFQGQEVENDKADFDKSTGIAQLRNKKALLYQVQMCELLSSLLKLLVSLVVIMNAVGVVGLRLFCADARMMG